ncbi:Protein atp12 like protein [Verticillium longisporum]|nr:Protein atp12 like protein [Verticillium longisporum]
MKAITRMPRHAIPRIATATSPLLRQSRRSLSSTVFKTADVAPVVGTGPPPEAPRSSAEFSAESKLSQEAAAKLARRKRQAEMLEMAQEIRNAASMKGVKGGLKRRFWKEVRVEEVDGALQVMLDNRPLRHPGTTNIIRLPKSKPHLASAVAIEWDLLTSAYQATKQHLIPLTSLICRALDIEANDNGEEVTSASAAAAAAAAADGEAAPAAPAPFSSTANPDDVTIRAQIATTLMRYLDTDAMLCWAPPPGPLDIRNEDGDGLRDVQEKTAIGVLAYLRAHVWPGVSIAPVLEGNAIVPRPQADGVRDIVKAWVSGLSSWELAGLERAVLAGKSVVAASRLVVEWSEDEPAGGLRPAREAGGEKFGVEQAAVATSLEVSWQTGHWGEVEDTHDVEKEDLRRQFGSVVLLVSGLNRR